MYKHLNIILIISMKTIVYDICRNIFAYKKIIKLDDLSGSAHGIFIIIIIIVQP